MSKIISDLGVEWLNKEVYRLTGADVVSALEEMELLESMTAEQVKKTIIIVEDKLTTDWIEDIKACIRVYTKLE